MSEKEETDREKVGQVLVGELMELDGVELGDDEAVTWRG